MNFYKRYMGDYQRDTASLTLAQHGAFSLLLDTYYSTEKPLPSDKDNLYRICRATGAIEKRAVIEVADKFFPIDPTDKLRHNARADAEIEDAKPRINAAKINGSKGGRRPKFKEPDG